MEDRVMLVGAIAERHGKARQTVLAAVRAGRLPALVLDAGGGRKFFAINPADAERLWGKKIPISA
ncbi:Uncharacterised protein [Mycobacteroides abscessus subsp. abscessus]|uniref:hypothetical protein n=1 Tax=Mycobacteroides abscessus TaxID=36809 RepID=UPI0009A7C844|nr:hypothetical protein [Mycobacteroides abscessus]SKF72900.1 Uncharacterised protein [Mycobacteroides abscessus subsp. abscessus]SKX74426.1 Uncharacterised protein [Mycobacteroides abscessus subsp. abscessus]